MVKFDSCFAIFGTLAAECIQGTPLGESIISYTNNACTELYGELRGKSIAGIFSEICSGKTASQQFLYTLESEGSVTFEGILSNRFIKYHSRIVSPHDHGETTTSFIQAGITDISESIILKKLLYGTSEALKRAAKAADEDTGRHVVRINNYAELLATLFNCNAKSTEEISQFSQLHDIGKIKVAEIIRLPRKLTGEEFESMKKHAYYGGEMVKGLAGLTMAYNIALEHHEKWDGSGYPYAKKGDALSLEGRIVAIADVFDALVSARPYKEAFKTYHIFTHGDGRVMPAHFDPALLKLFLDNYEQFVELHRTSKD
jgi:HD-GYP domain-containing protein (c-di-GMP phosphodiesterase class II)